MPKPDLRAVPDAAPVVVDIYASWKAEIASRDWEACHIRGDRSRPLEFVRRIVRGWRG